MTYKMIYLAQRNPALAPQDFAQAWREHSALGAQCTNVRDKVVSVRQCARVLSDPHPPGFSTHYDGVNLLTVKSLSAAHEIWSDPETLAVMRPDEPRVFSTYVRNFTLVCEEVSVSDPGNAIRSQPGGRCIVVGFLKAGAPLLDESFHQSLSLSKARTVVVNRVCEPPPAGYDFDLILEAWYESPTHAEQALGGQSPMEHLCASARAMLDASRCVWMFTAVTHHRP